MSVAYAFALFVAAAFALWLAASASRLGEALADRGNTGVRKAGTPPGIRVFTWLLIFVGLWCLISGVHAVVPTLAAKILVSKIQYFAIAGVPPLWLLFAFEYAGVQWTAHARARYALFALPAVMVVMAFTNEWHHAVWTNVTLAPDGFGVYEHGWFFWVAALYHYVLMLAGTIALMRTARRSPPPFRGQFIALICAAVLPWIGNLLFVAGATHPGVDLTPFGFTLACVLCGSALYRSHLFELVPVARDMVVDSLDDAVVVVDSARRVIDMNAAALHLIGTGARWAGRPVSTVLPLVADMDLEGHPGRTSKALVTPAGAKYYDINVIPLRLRQRRVGGCVVVLRDITQERAAALEHEALQARVHEQQRREGLSVLAAGLAHDFNNLLTGIVGNADLLSLQIPASTDLGHSVSAIQLGAQRAADLVSKMLAYAGERHGSLARVDLDVLVRDILDLLNASAARHCHVEYHGTRAVIDADPTQIRQVAMNLIINAAEAVDEESGSVFVTTGSEYLSPEQLREMKVSDDAGAAYYGFIEVRDNGSGMTAQTLSRIFHPFFTTKPTGHGLGLSAVQGIVFGHRGALRVDTSPGQGTRFCVWFPLAHDDEGATGSMDEREQGSRVF